MSANNSKWIAIIRNKVTGSHSRARVIWEKLPAQHRGILLHSAGMKSEHCRYLWDDFSREELHQLQRGIQRLRALVDTFGQVGTLDFVKESNSSRKSHNQPAPVKTYGPEMIAAQSMANMHYTDN
ncbi:TPA: hypothetical protein ACPY94_000525 [Yersinia enterocolitica]|uniref:Uncharacterized protein n=1 Tax=Yersinia mollaretii TaxID=33060 RepID=A0AA36PKZ6_YERMO|nr:MULTISPECIES: hypothetical protein [Yersinia]EEP92532.1 hypothetical protein ykris0001_4700 [Yersinia kristensenii ATCC 33638]EMA9486853.1 hypothetical protein [Yersinia enterocolitica]PEH52931.1 hypothetical protein CRM81_05925 [Yersinia kristensenii]UXD28816.1 hypothetical protein FORC066_1603 [Yersinia enterocolitica]CNH56756.1 Uncharacterised protein [Yersinia mollaretii]